MEDEAKVSQASISSIFFLSLPLPSSPLQSKERNGVTAMKDKIPSSLFEEVSDNDGSYCEPLPLSDSLTPEHKHTELRRRLIKPNYVAVSLDYTQCLAIAHVPKVFQLG